jgi:predicted protein tyrosine phosphatase
MNERVFQENEDVEINSGGFRAYVENISKLSNISTNLLYNSFYEDVSKSEKQKQKKNVAKTLKKIQKNITALKEEYQYLGKIVNKTLKHNRKILNAVSKKALRKKNNVITDDDLKDWKTLVSEDTEHDVESIYNLSESTPKNSRISTPSDFSFTPLKI